MFVKKIALAAISIGLISGLATIGLGTSKTQAATNGVKFNQSFKYFKVRGTSLFEILQDAKKTSPVKGIGTDFAKIGVAEIALIQEIEYVENNGRCSIGKLQIIVDVILHLPRWANYNRVNKIAKQSWNDFVAGIKKHELMHAAIAKDYGTRMYNKIAKIKPRSNCARVEADVTRNYNRLLNRHDRAQAIFDRREQKRLQRERREAEF